MMATAKGDRASKFETLKLLEKCRKERDDAVHRETVLRHKLRQYESRLRSTETLNQKLKTLTADNKELRKQVKALRKEIGLECSPRFHGKTTKDVVNDLHEKERACDVLIEKAAELSLTVDELTSELANAVTSKTLLPVKAFENKTGDAKTALDRPSFATYHNDNKSFMLDESTTNS